MLAQADAKPSQHWLTLCSCRLQVTDSCKECAGNNILVSERGFANLTGVNINISPVLQVGCGSWPVGRAAGWVAAPA